MTRVLLYAQVPPPVHGQNVMTAHLLDGLRTSGQTELTPPHDVVAQAGAAPIAFYHINPQISQGLADIGRWGARKIGLVFGYIWQAIVARFRYDLPVFYFVPGQPKREAVYRDAVVLLLVRPLFSRLVLHWHNIGQPEFIEKSLSAPERWLARLCYGRAALSIVLSNYSRTEASYFRSQRVEIVPNGIPDPCPQFDQDIWIDRQARAARRAEAAADAASGPSIYRVLFVAGRLTPKGLFDTLAAVTLANRRLMAENRPVRLSLTTAGPFENEDESARYEAAARDLDATGQPGSPLAKYVGWADEKKKHELYRDADCLCFPTTYSGESFGLVLAEAMAHGCAIVTTRWQAVPEVLPGGYENVVEPHDIDGLATSLLRCAAGGADRSLRDYFLARFTEARFVQDMVRVLGSA